VPCPETLTDQRFETQPAEGSMGVADAPRKKAYTNQWFEA
jgi:hypothetical protein